MAKKDDGFDCLYFINSIRGLRIFPLEEKDPAEWVSLSPIVQGRRRGEEAEPVSDVTATDYIRAQQAAEASSEDAELARLIREQEAESTAERAA